MGIQTLHDEEVDILSKYDGGVYASAISDCVCKGIGDEFELSYSNDSLNVSFSAGSEAVIGGAFFKVTSTEAITLSANAVIYLCANINLSQSPKGSFVQRTSTNMKSENINGSGATRDLLLYVITTGANGVVSVSDRRIIKGDGTAISGLGMTLASGDLKVADENNSFNFKTLTQAQYNALGTKDNNTLYFTTEN